MGITVLLQKVGSEVRGLFDYKSHNKHLGLLLVQHYQIVDEPIRIPPEQQVVLFSQRQNNPNFVTLSAASPSRICATSQRNAHALVDELKVTLKVSVARRSPSQTKTH